MPSSFTINMQQAFASVIGKKIARTRLRNDYKRAFQTVYPDIRYDNAWREGNRAIAGNESGVIIGAMVRILQSLPRVDRALLAGEHVNAKAVYRDILGIAESAITIAGLDSTSDYQWNFENHPPAMPGPYPLIISYAILEHLLNPYQHVCDMLGLLAPGGHLVIYTEMPNFQYHRHPVDCLRFFPDWFYETAKRNNVVVSSLDICEDHIVTTFKK